MSHAFNLIKTILNQWWSWANEKFTNIDLCPRHRARSHWQYHHITTGKQPFTCGDIRADELQSFKTNYEELASHNRSDKMIDCHSVNATPSRAEKRSFTFEMIIYINTFVIKIFNSGLKILKVPLKIPKTL